MATYGTDKSKIIEEYKTNEKDTGSVELQLALYTHRINHLVAHLKKFHKDKHTQNGLLRLVGRRKRIIAYLQKKKPDAYKAIAKKLKIKVKD